MGRLILLALIFVSVLTSHAQGQDDGKATTASRGIEPAELKLPGVIDNVAIGGRGRYLVCAIPAEQLAVVVDLAVNKVVKTIPVDDSMILVAASADSIYIAKGTNSQVARYSLPECELQLATAVTSAKGIAHIAVGSNSTGPVFVALNGEESYRRPDKGILVLDGTTHATVPSTWPDNASVHTTWGQNTSLEVSSDGRKVDFPQSAGAGSFQLLNNNSFYPLLNERSPSGNNHGRVRQIDGKQVFVLADLHEAIELHFDFNAVAAQQRASRGGRSQSDTAFLGPTVHQAGKSTPLCTLPWFQQFSLNVYNNSGRASRRHFLISNGSGVPADKLVYSPRASDKVLVYEFDLKRQLEDSQAEFLLVRSSPSLKIQPGETYTYDVDVLSSGSSADFELTYSPEGMTISGNHIEWKVPKDFPYSRAKVVVSVSNDSNRQVLQSFDIETGGKVGTAPSIVAATPKEPLASGTEQHDVKEIQLPFKIDDLCVGGEGKYVIVYSKSNEMLAILDVPSRSITHYIPAAGSGFRFAASKNRLIAISSGAGVVSLWELSTGKKLLSRAFSTKNPVAHLLAGHATDGPALGSFSSNRESELFEFDLETLKPTVTVFSQPRRGMRQESRVRVSANGATFCVWDTNTSPSGLQIYQRSRSGVYEGAYEHDSVGAIIPSADGKTLFTQKGLFSGLTQMLDEQGFLYSPAVQGDLYLRVPISEAFRGNGQAPPSPPVTVHRIGSSDTIVRLPIPTWPDDQDSWGRSHLTFEQRMVFIPHHNAIVALSKTLNGLTIHPLDLRQRLVDSGVDYLLVMSTPETIATVDSTYRYAIDVLSKRKGVTFELASAPEGMEIDRDGVITWEIPPAFAQEAVGVFVDISDASGQQVWHKFEIRLPEVTERLERERKEKMLAAQLAEEQRVAEEEARKAQEAASRQQRRSEWMSTMDARTRSDDLAKGPRTVNIEQILRTWTDKLGNEVLGYYDGIFAGNVLIRRPDGSMIAAPGAELSTDDRTEAIRLFRETAETRKAANAWKTTNAQRQGQRANELKLASVDKLARISAALTTVRTKTRSALPPASFDTETGRPLLSWRVHLLPYLDMEDLYNEFRLDEPWCSDHNLALVQRMPSIYQTPGGRGDGRTHYLMVDQKVARGVGRGSSQPILVVEVGDPQAATWTRPGEFQAEESDLKANIDHLFSLRQNTCLGASWQTVVDLRRPGTLDALQSWLRGQAGSFTQQVLYEPNQ